VREFPLSLQERLETTVFGRALISAFLLVTLASIVFANLPQSKLRRDVLRADEYYLNAAGVDQTWSLFAPEPRRQSVALRARVQYANGSTHTWRVPRGDDLIGSYWDYHWQKWLEFVVDDNHADLWKPAAQFIARDCDGPGRRSVRVTLIRTISLNRPPGRHPDHTRGKTSAYYSLDITPAMLGRRR
jgi:hypothetical protein